jgi:hypothetical protein
MPPIRKSGAHFDLAEPPFGRHARACRGHPRLSFDVSAKEGVDGRDKPGHD